MTESPTSRNLILFRPLPHPERIPSRSGTLRTHHRPAVRGNPSHSGYGAPQDEGVEAVERCGGLEDGRVQPEEGHGRLNRFHTDSNPGEPHQPSPDEQRNSAHKTIL